MLANWLGERYTRDDRGYRDQSRVPGVACAARTYGLACLEAALAFAILTRAIIRADGSDSPVAAAIGRDVKGHASLVLYAAATGLAFVSPVISYALFVAVAVMWFVPDRRLSRR
jgi:uncharacterized membrane protein